MILRIEVINEGSLLAGKKSNTTRTVILIVVPSAVVSLMLLNFIFCFLKRRRPMEIVGSKLNLQHLLLAFCLLQLKIEIIIISENDKKNLFSINN